jgi:PAS domain S-box-containing protein
MKYRLQDLIDLEQFQSLMDRLNVIYPFPSAVIDNEGVILVATAWQDICTKFHRPNKECERDCIKSDQYILEHLAEANPAVSYRCPRGLIDNAMPIIVDGQHLGSFFTGQFFLEEPDLAFFREQAGKFGFDEVAYLEAVKKVPIWSLEQLESYLAFIKEMIDVLSSVGLKNLKSIEAAEAARESQYFFKESQRAAFIGSYKADFTAATWESSEVLDRIFGIDQEFFRSIQNWVELVHPDDREMMGRYLREEVIAQSKPFNKEYRIIRKSDGEIRWVNGLGEIQLDREGQGVALIGTVQDITERKRAEEKLRKSEARWRLSVENMTEGYALHEAIFDESGRMVDFRYIEFNPAAQKIVGIAREDIIGKTAMALFPNITERGLMARYAEVMATGEATYIDDFYYSGDILDKAFDISCFPIDDRHFVCVFRDITDRKRNEEALRESNSRYQAFFEGGPDGVVILNPETAQIIEFNDQVCHQLGYSREEFGRLCIADIEAVETAEETRTRIQGIQREGRGDFETRQRTKQGEIRAIQVTAQTIKFGGQEAFHCVWRDISERKRAEEALRDSEYRWKFAVEGSGDGLWDWNLLENTVFFSTRWKETLGFAVEEIGSGLDEWTNRVHADDLARVMADVQAHLAGTTTLYSNEYRLRCKDGSWKWILDRGVVVSRDDGGKPLRMIGTHTDVTERKRAEKALNDSEQRLRSYFNSPIIGIAITSPEKGWLETNPRLCAMLGYSLEELQGGMTWAELTHPDDIAADVAQFERLLAGEIDDYSMEKRFVRKSGEIIWTRLGVGGVRKSDGIVGYAVATLEDITERKQAEEERVRLMAAIEQVAETIVITDAEGTIQYVNPCFEQVTGYTCDEALGQNPRILNSGEHDQAFYKAMWETLKRGEVWTGQMVNKKKDGTRFTEDATISPVRDASGETVNYVAVKRDVTHEIELNTQLRQAQKMEAVGQLAGGIAHDFNNLLQAILGYGYLALRDVGEDRPAHAFIEEMTRAGERATTLVRQLLAFSRRQVLDMKDVNLNDSIADVLKMLRRVIGEHITLDVISSDDLGIVRADPGQIDQILMNLCVNARDAMGKSGKITIETENVRIDDEFCEAFTWARPGRYVLLSVTDTGCGMDQETLGKVFEPFFTTKDVGKGTGLGLATVYGVVRQHEGLLHVYSEPGQGTTFKIYLPLAERSTAVVGKKIEGPVPDGTETILLAEDNETLLKLTKHFLEFAGYTVLTAIDGEDALRVFEEHADEIDMALLDVMMPKLGGKAVYERIRKTRPDLPFLFASGYSMNAIHTNFVLDEGLQLIQKPYRRVDLLRKVREVLDGGSVAPNDKSDMP